MTEPTQQFSRGSLDSAERPEPLESWQTSDEDSPAETPRHASTPSSDDGETTEMPAARPAPAPAREAPRRRTPALGRGLKPGSRLRGVATATTGTWIGVVLVAAGFAAIFYTWGKVAGVLNVAQQLPYLVSGGLSGLALVIVGVAVVDVAVRRQDSSERHQQIAQMTRTLAELRELFEAEEPLDDEEFDDREGQA